MLNLDWKHYLIGALSALGSALLTYITTHPL